MEMMWTNYLKKGSISKKENALKKASEAVPRTWHSDTPENCGRCYFPLVQGFLIMQLLRLPNDLPATSKRIETVTNSDPLETQRSVDPEKR